MEKIKSSAQLITLPEIYLRLKELLADPDYTMAEVALLISHDPGLAARVLRIVNSPLNRRTAKIEKISYAVSLLGAQQVHDVVLCASVTETFDGIHSDVVNMKQFWQRSIYCAITARQLAIKCKVECERLFLLGLLADIGHLFMYLSISKQAQQAIVQAHEEQRPLYLIENEQLGFNYAEVGGMMMKEWSLPRSLQIPITYQTDPGKAKPFPLETGLLHIAILLVQADLGKGEFGEGVYVVNKNAWTATDLTLEDCLNARDIAAEQFKIVTESILG
ncbi:MAG: HDOD domain-containing protein [Desulfuromusa sp.]|nr:HDOD domain-containing protein [Desulfuromusa sp.]